MDFATILSPNLTFDWAIENGDLAVDAGFDTAVALSLWSDRVLNPDDVNPDGTGDLGGWWGDTYLPPLPDGTPDHIGSRLRLLNRALQTQETAQNAQAHSQEALHWMVLDGVAASVTTPLPTFPRPGAIEIINLIAQKLASGAVINRRYTSLWDWTRNTVSFSGIVVGGL